MSYCTRVVYHDAGPELHTIWEWRPDALLYVQDIVERHHQQLLAISFSHSSLCLRCQHERAKTGERVSAP